MESKCSNCWIKSLGVFWAIWAKVRHTEICAKAPLRGNKWGHVLKCIPFGAESDQTLRACGYSGGNGWCTRLLVCTKGRGT